jgi:NitT/TauT family transport system permease protein
MIVFVAAFAPCVLNAQRGVAFIDPVLLEASKTFGARPLILFWRVLIPGALPQIIAGMRIGAGLGWQSLVGAELIVGNTGLGYAMTQSVQNLDTPTLIVCMVSIGLIGAAIDYGLAYVEARSRRTWRQT